MMFIPSLGRGFFCWRWYRRTHTSAPRGHTVRGDADMSKWKRYAAFFIIGGVGYALIELLWRGRTHWSMMLAGGLCFLLLSRIAARYGDRPLFLRAALAALAVTLVEWFFGVTFNILLQMNVWDYSGVPLNFYGQICLGYTLLWGALALIFLPVAGALNKKLAVS